MLLTRRRSARRRLLLALSLGVLALISLCFLLYHTAILRQLRRRFQHSQSTGHHFDNLDDFVDVLYDSDDAEGRERALEWSRRLATMVHNWSAVAIENDNWTRRRTFPVRFANTRLDYNMTGPVIPLEYGEFAVRRGEGSEGQCNETTRLFVFVPSRPSSFSVREEIRRSWAADLPKGVVLKFIVGQRQDEDVHELVLGELAVKGDLIVYSLEDTYENLYLKVHAALQWQQTYCPQADYVLKTDDDTVVDVERLLHWIDHKFSPYTVRHPNAGAEFGVLWRRVAANRDPASKWYVSRESYPERLYPSYLNGPSYLLSAKAVTKILAAAPNVSAIPVEDVLYTGVLATEAGVSKKDVSAHFRTNAKVSYAESCERGVPKVTAIYPVQKPSKLRSAYAALKGAKCK